MVLSGVCPCRHRFKWWPTDRVSLGMSDGQFTKKLFDLCDTLSRCHDKMLCHPDSHLRSSPHAVPWVKGDHSS